MTLPFLFAYSPAGAPNYFPNSFNGPSDDPKYAQSQIHYSGDVRRYRTDDDDNYSQPGVFWREVLTDEDRAALVKNMAGHLKDAVPFIQDRVVSFRKKSEANMNYLKQLFVCFSLSKL